MGRVGRRAPYLGTPVGGVFAAGAVFRLDGHELGDLADACVSQSVDVV